MFGDAIDLFDFFIAALATDFEMAIGHQLSSCGLIQNLIIGLSDRVGQRQNRVGQRQH